MRRCLIFITAAGLVASTWLALTVGRVEPVVRNLVYFHVPSSVTALLCFVVILVGSIAFLKTGRCGWDALAAAAAEVGLVFATVLNATGSVFSRAEWQTWWTPSPRLVTSAILWFLYVGYLILRSSIASPGRRGRICAVFGIIAFLDVPLVFLSARFTRDIHKPDFSFGSSAQYAAFGIGVLATLCLAVILIWLRYDMIRTADRLEKQLLSDST